MNRFPGLFFALEGGEGSGKTEAAKRCASGLKASGFEHVLTRHPGSTPLGIKIRSLLLDTDEVEIDPEAELELFGIDFRENLKRVILPALVNGKLVIADRYIPSTLAYQGAAGQIDHEYLQQRLSFWTQGKQPDRVYLIDIDPQTGLSRANGPGDRIEAKDIQFHEAVRASYLRQAADNPERFMVVDGRQSQNQVARTILVNMLTTIEQKWRDHEAVS